MTAVDRNRGSSWIESESLPKRNWNQSSLWDGEEADPTTVTGFFQNIFSRKSFPESKNDYLEFPQMPPFDINNPTPYAEKKMKEQNITKDSKLNWKTLESLKIVHELWMEEKRLKRQEGDGFCNIV